MTETTLVKWHQRKEIAELTRKGMSLLDTAVAWMGPAAATQESAPENLSQRSIKVGLWAIFLVFGVFGLWAALAPLYSAALAEGKVVLDTNRKTIQHLEGGIVKDILVHEGDFVAKDAPLIRLDETAAKAKLDLLRGQSISARAAEARLLAERDNKTDIVFPEDLLAQEGKDPLATENLDSQRRLFTSRRDNLDGQTAILKQKIEQAKQEIEGLRAQEQSANNQIKLLDEEIATVTTLLEKGNALKPRLLALRRNAAALRGERGESLAGISRIQQNIAESEIAMINLKNDFLNKVVAELKETQGQVAELDEKLRASSDTVTRIIIAAPISGIVTGLKVHTVGGVIAPGEAIMDLVPRDDKLIVEARVKPQDIDEVRAGLKARLRLTAYKTRRIPPVEGTVSHVSPDIFIEERTGAAYYTARIEVDHSQLKTLGGSVELYPGMPVETHIVTGARTFFSYMFAPITDYLSRAFREQ